MLEVFASNRMPMFNLNRFSTLTKQSNRKLITLSQAVYAERNHQQYSNVQEKSPTV